MVKGIVVARGSVAVDLSMMVSRFFRSLFGRSWEWMTEYWSGYCYGLLCFTLLLFLLSDGLGLGLVRKLFYLLDLGGFG